ncbi:MAG: hypothetical protein RLZZ436_2991 [Planctomycetota bacterium]|jgi:hypothetical protein
MVCRAEGFAVAWVRFFRGDCMRSWNVRRFVAALSLSSALLASAAVADEQKPAAEQPAAAAPVAQAQPAPQHVHRVNRRPAKQTFFQRVMELERRKNAWLMRTFLGR